MKKLVFVVLGCLFATGALAETQAFQLSLIPDVAVQARTTHIKGFSLGLWSENPQSALALGVVNGSTGNSSGLSLALLGSYAQNYEGVQLAFIANYTEGKASGLQWAAFNYAGNLKGFQLGFVNYAKKTEKGLQVGIINIMNENRVWFRNFPDEVAPGMILVNWRL